MTSPAPTTPTTPDTSSTAERVERVECYGASYTFNAQPMTIHWRRVGGWNAEPTFGRTETTQDDVARLEGRDDGGWGDTGCVAAVRAHLATLGAPSSLAVVMAPAPVPVVPPRAPLAATADADGNAVLPEQTPA